MYKYKLTNKINEDAAESSVAKFHQERIQAFEDIKNKLNQLYPLLDTAKKETIDYYNQNNKSYEIVYPTDLVNDYIDDIIELIESSRI
jgi:hypothetical protein